MRKNLFEMGADWDKGWSSDNKNTEVSPSKRNAEILPPEKHRLYCTREKRRGKIVTLIQPFALEKSVQQTLLKDLKKKLGTGGTAKENTLEIQGDLTNLIERELSQMGYRFRR